MHEDRYGTEHPGNSDTVPCAKRFFMANFTVKYITLCGCSGCGWDLSPTHMRRWVRHVYGRLLRPALFGHRRPPLLVRRCVLSAEAGPTRFTTPAVPSPHQQPPGAEAGYWPGDWDAGCRGPSLERIGLEACMACCRVRLSPAGRRCPLATPRWSRWSGRWSGGSAGEAAGGCGPRRRRCASVRPAR